MASTSFSSFYLILTYMTTSPKWYLLLNKPVFRKQSWTIYSSNDNSNIIDDFRILHKHFLRAKQRYLSKEHRQAFEIIT